MQNVTIGADTAGIGDEVLIRMNPKRDPAVFSSHTRLGIITGITEDRLNPGGATIILTTGDLVRTVHTAHAWFMSVLTRADA